MEDGQVRTEPNHLVVYHFNHRLCAWWKHQAYFFNPFNEESEVKLAQEEQVYWLDGFEGEAKGGAYYRSKIGIDIDTFQTKFNKKVVAIGISKDYDSDKPSWNVNMITEMTQEDKLKDIAKAGHIGTLGSLASGTDAIHEAEEAEKEDK